MSFRFFRFRPQHASEIDPAKATFVGSAEAAWPFRGPGRTVEQNLEGLRRTRRLRDQVRQQQQSD